MNFFSDKKDEISDLDLKDIEGEGIKLDKNIDMKYKFIITIIVLSCIIDCDSISSGVCELYSDCKLFIFSFISLEVSDAPRLSL